MDTEVSPDGDVVAPKKAAEAVNWPGIVLYIVLTFGLSWTIWLAATGRLKAEPDNLPMPTHVEAANV